MRNKYRLAAKNKAMELVSKMTLEEKASQLTYNSKPIKRLGIKAYNWWSEGLHGIARAGTATVFPQAIALGAMFDDEFLQEIADCISMEARAKYNAFQEEGDYDIYKGLTLWSPNVNIFRDPRWGRGHETYGEDPYLSGKLGVSFIKGLQGEGEHLKTAACVKHFAVHSGPEDERHSFNAEISLKDLYETYLPAFYDCVVQGDVESVMGAYNRLNGEPCCGSLTLLKEILRDEWRFEGHVVSDCWAIKDFHEYHMVTSNAVESVALAMKAGCDLNCGNMYLNLLLAHKEGRVTEQEITQACERLFTTRYYLGMFDAIEFDTIPYSVVDCAEHNALSLKAAERSAVLLKNDGVLPLKKEQLKNIAVIGPNAASIPALRGNYYGTSSRYVTFLQGIQQEVQDGGINVYYSEGCHLYKERSEFLAMPDDRISEAVIAAKNSDVVILCLGLDETQEGEEGDDGNNYGSGDKKDLKLPQSQLKLLEAIMKLNKKTILLLSAGSAIDLNEASIGCHAILQTWYLGASGGTAAANILFGKTSPSGKLPITFYADESELPDFKDYSMDNRTYRYFNGSVLYPFGYGLNYGNVKITEFESMNSVEDKPSNSSVSVEVTIFNDSEVKTEDVVQIYVKDLQSPHAVKNHSLCGFKRVLLMPFETKKIEIIIPEAAFTIVDQHGKRYKNSEKFCLFAGTGQPDRRSTELLGYNPKTLELTFKE